MAKIRSQVTIIRIDDEGRERSYISEHIGDEAEAIDKAIRKHFGQKAYLAFGYIAGYAVIMKAVEGKPDEKVEGTFKLHARQLPQEIDFNLYREYEAY